MYFKEWLASIKNQFHGPQKLNWGHIVLDFLRNYWWNYLQVFTIVFILTAWFAANDLALALLKNTSFFWPILKWTLIYLLSPLFVLVPLAIFRQNH